MTSLTIDSKEAALLVIDMQNGFCHPDGTLGKDGADISMMKDIIPNVRRLIELCAERDIPQIWTIQEHFPEDKSRDMHRIPHHTAKRFRPPCLKGTWDAEIVDELKPLITGRSHLIRKQKFSAFYNTNLEVLTRILGVRTLIVSGVSSNACVETSLREAYMRDYDLLIVADCIGGVSREFHDFAVRVWARFLGMVINVTDLPELLVSPPGSGRANDGVHLRTP